jgi:hypothetical protein
MSGFVQMPGYRFAEEYSTVDRSIVRCSVTQQILAICSTALIILSLSKDATFYIKGKSRQGLAIRSKETNVPQP